MARPRKPTAEKILNGNPGRRPLPDNEPQFDGVPQMPEWLDDDGRALWDSVVSKLTAAGVSREIDSPSLAAMCRWWSLWRRLDRQLNSGEMAWKDICAASAAWKQFSAIASKFGLTPVDRTKLKVDKLPTDEDDPLAAILRKRAEAN